MTPFVRPPALKPGGAIGVVAPCSAIRDARLQAGIDALRALGYRVVEGEHLHDRHGYLAGSDTARGRDLTAMFAREDIDAVFCGRGGYGACRMLDYVDWDVVRAHPKVFAGYSDVTTLQLAMERQAGLITFHGPMAVTHGGGLDRCAADCFWRLVTRPEPLGVFDTGGRPVRTLVAGQARGRLGGGCLALLAAAVGAPEQPDFAGRIVAIEDVGEQAYRVDRLLVQLLRAGLLQRAAGFVVGTVTDWNKTGAPQPVTLDDVWRDLLAPLGKPTILDFPFGHVPDPLTLPLGCMAELDADAGTLTVTEAAVG